MSSRILAIGDIHGCSRALDTLLAEVNFGRDDLLVTLGDYVDRGPDSRGVIERLLELRERKQLVSLRGNHEIMMLQARDEPESADSWRRVGGEETLASYGGSLDGVPARHWDFIENGCLNFWENSTHFFVHAGAFSDLELADQPNYKLFWERFDFPAPHISGKVMVCGHTSQKSGLPINIGHAICLDTWAYGRGWLSCLDTTSGRLWQANQAGESREMWIEDV